VINNQTIALFDYIFSNMFEREKSDELKLKND